MPEQSESTNSAPNNVPSKMPARQLNIIKRRYVIDGDNPSLLSKEYNIPIHTLKAWAKRKGWTDQRARRHAIMGGQDVETETDIVAQNLEDQRTFYEELQIRAEGLAKTSLDMAETTKTANELSTNLASVKMAVNLFQDASEKLGCTIDPSPVKQQGGVYNLFFMQDVEIHANSQGNHDNSPIINVTPDS